MIVPEAKFGAVRARARRADAALGALVRGGAREPPAERRLRSAIDLLLRAASLGTRAVSDRR
jgi:hypothetical protein